MLVCVWSNFCQDGKWLEGFGLDQPKQLSIVVGVRNWYKRLTWSIMVLIKKQNYSQGTDSHAETIEFDAIGPEADLEYRAHQVPQCQELIAAYRA